MAESITFVCCVESGALETYTLRMIESLRRWGGKFADSPIIAVNPRFGPPLAAKTLEVFKKFDVEYIRYRVERPYPWYAYLNKPLALIAAQEKTESEFICWLDSDVIVVDEPSHLLPVKEDFLASVTNKNMGTSGKQDANNPYWQEICSRLGTDIEKFPWVTTQREGINIRLYWNSGVFVYRRCTDFAQYFLQTNLDILELNIASQNSGIYFIEQVALAVNVVKMGISWGELPYSHNYAIGSKTYEEWYKEEDMKAAKIVHYHDAMWPWFWDTFIECLDNTHPPVAQWLRSHGPMKNNAPVQWRLVRKLLEAKRSRQKIAYRQSCRVM